MRGQATVTRNGGTAPAVRGKSSAGRSVSQYRIAMPCYGSGVQVMSEVQSVERTLAILERLAESGACGVQQLARELGLAPSTVQRLLGALVAAAVVEQDPADRSYRVSWTLFRWGQAPLTRLGLRELAKPFLQELAAEVGETIALGIRDGDSVMHVEWVPAQHLVQPRTKIGDRVPLLDSSLGRCLIAWVGEEQRSALIDDAARRQGTRSRRGAKSLDEALREVRAKGYSLVEDAIAGVRTIAAPVWGSTDSVIGAIGIGGLASRFTAERATTALPSLIAISDAVTGHYGVDPARIRSRTSGIA
jgi:IclR family transcriptional regulator, acetate operon repressor